MNQFHALTSTELLKEGGRITNGIFDRSAFSFPLFIESAPRQPSLSHIQKRFTQQLPHGLYLLVG